MENTTIENNFILASSPRRIFAFLVDSLLFLLLSIIVSLIVKGGIDKNFLDSKFLMLYMRCT